jgi:CopA family copper-resistance protein
MTCTNSSRASLLGIGLALVLSSTATAGEYNITVDRVRVDTGKFTKTGIGYNGSATPTVLRFKEGEDVTIKVTNNLPEDTSIHWHGLILPFQEDGVPDISFDGIEPGETFTYNFPIVQSGTYWFHSHSGFQEPDGAYGSIVIEPEGREPFRYDREYVVQLTDAHPHSGSRIMRNLKMSPDYYNRKQRTLFDFISDAQESGLGAALSDRRDWGKMRMMPTDIEDLQGFTPLINGMGPNQNWTGLFEPGERVRLRFINSSAMAYFDIRIPGLKMTVVQADGNNVQPVTVDELRIAVAETYDVIVRPRKEDAYTIFAESMGRTAYARGTLAIREGLEAEMPELRDDPLLTMADMGMAHGDMGMAHGDMGMAHGGMGMAHGGMGNGSMEGMGHSAMTGAGGTMPDMPTIAEPGAGMGQSQVNDGTMAAGTHTMPDGTKMEGMDQGGGSSSHVMADGTTMSGMDHGAGGAMATSDPFYAPGSGLAPTAANGGKFLSYGDLKAQNPLYEDREATREIELRLTGNMERYIWSINGVKFEDAEPIRLQYLQIRERDDDEPPDASARHVVDSRHRERRARSDQTHDQRCSWHDRLYGNRGRCAGPMGVPLPPVLSRRQRNVPQSDRGRRT